jgi:type IV secretory pathway TrbD component
MSLSTRTRRARTRRSRTRRALTRRSLICGVRRRLRLLRGDAGMSTVEYAIGCVAAAGFAALLYSVVTV